MSKTKFKRRYEFDYFMAEHLHVYFNHCIVRYGSVSVADFVSSPLFLGLDKGDPDYDKYTKMVYYEFGWDEPLKMVDMFEVKTTPRGYFVYELKLPKCKVL